MIVPKSEYTQSVCNAAMQIMERCDIIDYNFDRRNWKLEVKIQGIIRFDIYCKSQRVYDYTMAEWRDFIGSQPWLDIRLLLETYLPEPEKQALFERLKAHFERKLELAEKNNHNARIPIWKNE